MSSPSPGSRSPTDTDILVGENVRRIRIEMNQTLSEMANALGISHQQLQKYETGSNRLSAGMLKKIADHFGIGVGILFEDANSPAAKPVVPPSALFHIRAAQASLAKILGDTE